MNKLALSFALVASLATAVTAENRTGTAAAGSPMATVTAEVQKTFGFVPDFVKQLPQALVANWWHGVTTFEMNPTTKLDGKTKELIGLAVAAAAPCEYCIYFHTEAARLNGASEEEIKEAVGMAGLTRAGSTVLNGLQIDKVQFKKDVQRIVTGARAAKK